MISSRADRCCFFGVRNTGPKQSAEVVDASAVEDESDPDEDEDALATCDVADAEDGLAA